MLSYPEEVSNMILRFRIGTFKSFSMPGGRCIQKIYNFIVMGTITMLLKEKGVSNLIIS